MAADRTLYLCDSVWVDKETCATGVSSVCRVGDFSNHGHGTSSGSGPSSGRRACTTASIKGPFFFNSKMSKTGRPGWQRLLQPCQDGRQWALRVWSAADSRDVRVSLHLRPDVTLTRSIFPKLRRSDSPRGFGVCFAVTNRQERQAETPRLLRGLPDGQRQEVLPSHASSSQVMSSLWGSFPLKNVFQARCTTDVQRGAKTSHTLLDVYHLEGIC